MKLFIQVLNLNILNRDLELNLYRKIEIRKKKKKRKTKNKLKKEEEDEVVYSGTQRSFAQVVYGGRHPRERLK